jgi:polyhydroxybutyrate depolymerase
VKLVATGLAFAVLYVASQGVNPVAAALDPGDHRIALQHGGRERSYIVHVPPAAGEGRPLSVVLNFHGGGGNAENQQKYSRMDMLADAEGFLAVYPDGTGRMPDRLLTWNAGTCCAYSVINRVDDVDFTLALLADLEERQPVDRRRVYATGLSNGAMMAWRLAVEAAGQIAAIAPVAGARVLQAGTPGRPVSVMHFHSVDDPRALYAGGLGPPFPMTTSHVFHSAVEPTVRDWAATIGCPADARVTVSLKGQAGSREAGHTATRYEWAPCREGSEVVLWKFTGTGHVWPGGLQDYLPRLLGPSTALVDANLEMWRFFQRFQLDALSRTR